MRERGLKFTIKLSAIVLLTRRSREGAWIEIYTGYAGMTVLSVAPVRERGLKYQEKPKHY